MNSYIQSFLNKVECLFWNEDILDISFVYDEEDKEQLDQVLFVEKTKNSVVGIYINGMNPMFSVNRIKDFDDFNLYASYDFLGERRKDKFLKFKVNFIYLFFNSKYNDLCGLFLSSDDEHNSILLLFMQDAIYLALGCSKLEIIKILNKNFLHISSEQFLIYEKNSYQSEWHKVII